MLDLDDPNQGKDASLALARKWRPHRFAEVIGQDHAVRTLRNALASGRLHHAYMFTGTRGIGKTTLARILAKSFNCGSMSDGEPCCECDSCRQVDIGNHPDVIEMDAASTTQVDRMRELLDSAQYAPSSGTYKVYIIDEVHMLSRHSFNAMLKTLEEPPGHIKFILATTDPQQVPATVQSRCLRFSLRRLPTDKVAGHLAMVLKSEGIEFDGEALSMIAAQADGSVRDGLSVLEEAIAAEGEVRKEKVRDMLGLAGVELVPKLLGLVLAGNAKDALALADDMHAKGSHADTVLAGLVEAVHRSQLARHSHGLREDIAEELRDVDEVKAQLVYEIATQAIARLPAAPDPKVAFDMALLRMVSLFGLASKPKADGSEGAVKKGAAKKGKEKGSSASNAPAKDSAAVPAGTGGTKEKFHQRSKESAIDTLPSTGEGWEALSASLDVQVGSLARKCSLSGTEGNIIRLEISPADKALLQYQDRMQEQISKKLGIDVKVEVAVREGRAATPADGEEARRERQKNELFEEVERGPELDRIRKSFPGSKIDRDSVTLDDDG